MKCKCHPLSPFNWRGTKPVIDWGQVQRAKNSSASTTDVVNRNRANGIDISHRMPGGTDRPLDPKLFHVFSLAKSK